ncbi:helix-turn-helix domain-containing protein [Bacillus sp. JJ722]|uniref:helix-turn-helix domain-containing protein n=1 Tax=Bacillus sp. JJ722 TaxID=3122973 RepID=UPI0030009A6F
MERKIFDKKNPTEGDKTFVALPSDARHYVHHDRMAAEKLYLYALIIDYYNAEDGFAFPSIETLAVKYGKAPDTTSKHVEDLKAVGLIDYPQKGHYIPLVPLIEEEFYRQFPEAFTNYQTAFKRCESRRDGARERARLWRERKYAE